MPANLTPQYMSAEQRFKQASTHEGEDRLPGRDAARHSQA